MEKITNTFYKTSALAITLMLIGTLGVTSVLATSVVPNLYSPWTSGNAYFERDEAGYSSCPYAYKTNWIEGQSMNGEYLIYLDEYGKVIPFEDLTGSETDPIAKIVISNDNGIYFDWELVGILIEKTIDGQRYSVEYVMCAVIVKGGTSANVFEYDDATSDTQLYAPINPNNNKLYGISHATFVFCEILTLIPQEIEYCYETAYGKGTGSINFIPTFSNWGWTNRLSGYGTYEFELWAGAAQCDTTKGTLVGTVTVVYGAGTLDVTFNVKDPYILMNEDGEVETHVYAGSNPYPTIKVKGGTKPTVAPGQYSIDYSALNGQPIYVIVHAIVGIPCE
ncbi:MAG: hypothetical protein QXD82_06110 [Nitrososphaerales archaeon]